METKKTDKKKMTQVNFMIDSEAKEAFVKKCDEKGYSYSKVLRNFMKDFISSK